MIYLIIALLHLQLPAFDAQHHGRLIKLKLWPSVFFLRPEIYVVHPGWAPVNARQVSVGTDQRTQGGPSLPCFGRRQPSNRTPLLPVTQASSPLPSSSFDEQSTDLQLLSRLMHPEIAPSALWSPNSVFNNVQRSFPLVY